MYKETKLAVKQAISVCRVLFAMSEEDYNKLLSAVSVVSIPTQEDLLYYDLPKEMALIKELEKRYKEAAIESGFSEKQGLAILKYAALQKSLKE